MDKYRIWKENTNYYYKKDKETKETKSMILIKLE